MARKQLKHEVDVKMVRKKLVIDDPKRCNQDHDQKHQQMICQSNQKKKNDTKYGRSKSKTRLKRPKTTKATGQIVTFFSATEQKTSSPFPSITQSSSDIDFTYGATEISKDKMTASNLKKYMSMLDDSSIKTRKKIGDSFKLFRQALNE
eukprot:368873_1